MTEGKKKNILFRSGFAMLVLSGLSFAYSSAANSEDDNKPQQTEQSGKSGDLSPQDGGSQKSPELKVSSSEDEIISAEPSYAAIQENPKSSDMGEYVNFDFPRRDESVRIIPGYNTSDVELVVAEFRLGSYNVVYGVNLIDGTDTAVGVFREENGCHYKLDGEENKKFIAAAKTIKKDIEEGTLTVNAVAGFVENVKNGYNTERMYEEIGKMPTGWGVSLHGYDYTGEPATASSFESLPKDMKRFDRVDSVDIRFPDGKEFVTIMRGDDPDTDKVKQVLAQFPFGNSEVTYTFKDGNDKTLVSIDNGAFTYELDGKESDNFIEAAKKIGTNFEEGTLTSDDVAKFVKDTENGCNIERMYDEISRKIMPTEWKVRFYGYDFTDDYTKFEQVTKASSFESLPKDMEQFDRVGSVDIGSPGGEEFVTIIREYDPDTDNVKLVLAQFPVGNHEVTYTFEDGDDKTSVSIDNGAFTYELDGEESDNFIAAAKNIRTNFEEDTLTGDGVTKFVKDTKRACNTTRLYEEIAKQTADRTSFPGSVLLGIPFKSR